LSGDWPGILSRYGDTEASRQEGVEHEPRDAVDVRFEKDGREYIIIDTAGVRKIGKMKNDIEYYGYTRATRSIRRADVVLFMMDATTKISQVDKKLCALIYAEYKP